MRILSPRDRVRGIRPGGAEGALRVAREDPVANALPGARLQQMRGQLGIGQEFSVIGDLAAPEAVLWHGVNIAPMGGQEAHLLAFADHLRSRSRRASSVVGPRRPVERLWNRLEGDWGRDVREYRWSQPLLLADRPGQVTPHPRVRPAIRGEERLVFPAAVAMFREEVGTDPLQYDEGRGYRARVRDLIVRGRTYVWIDQDGVVFKADVGALFAGVAQIHGVWVRPDRRSTGIARAAMAAVVAQVQRDHAPLVSLYVNDFNEPARRAYAAAGFRTVGELSTILF